MSKGVDVICGGFPCQDISEAGKKKGLEGERSGLWFEYKRLIKEIKPRYAIIENVRNLRSKGLATILKDLREIGYDCEWHIISARAVGAPHLRERIWIIAYPSSEGLRQQSRGSSRESGQEEIQLRADGENEHTEIADTCGKGLEGLRSTERVQQENTCTYSSHDQSPNTDNLRLWKSFTTEGLDKPRKERIKQLGNAVVPQIPELMGRAILEWEKNNDLLDERP
jgi:DNA (cytosine-5)-methyltransferase 1